MLRDRLIGLYNAIRFDGFVVSPSSRRAH